MRDSTATARRPAGYDHRTAKHPSVYDDFDSIMAAAHLLSTDGAGYALEGAAWDAAYDYYGHDATGVLYADQVLARAIGWSQHGFCINCGLDEGLVQAVDAAYGAPGAGGADTPKNRPSARPPPSGPPPGRGAGPVPTRLAGAGSSREQPRVGEATAVSWRPAVS